MFKLAKFIFKYSICAFLIACVMNFLLLFHGQLLKTNGKKAFVASEVISG